MASIRINGRDVEVSAADDKPLLWVLRDDVGLKGTKYSCGAGLCGVCTVLVDGRPVHSCIYPVAKVGDAEVTTIEGLTQDPRHPVLEAWIAERVPQCGYCQPEQILTARLTLSGDRYPDSAARGDFFRRLIEELEAQPDVVNAAVISITKLVSDAL